MSSISGRLREADGDDVDSVNRTSRVKPIFPDDHERARPASAGPTTITEIRTVVGFGY